MPRNLAAVAALALLVLPAAAGGTQTSSAVVGSASGSIVFGVFHGHRTIDVVSSDGGGLHQLAPHADAIFAASPNGQELAISRENGEDCAGCDDLYLTSVSSGQERPLTTGSNDGDPAWSPDGTLVAFIRCQTTAGERCAIFTIAPDGSNLRRLSPWGDGGLGPVWSPDGSHIAFYQTRQEGIYVMAADGSGLRRITREGGIPTWSPNSTQITFTRQIPLGHRESRPDIYEIRVDGTGLRRLTHTGPGNEAPAWSPDGKLIAFVAWRRTHSLLCPEVAAIYTMFPDGSHRHQLTPFGFAWTPIWSPDGAQIAFIDSNPQPVCRGQELRPFLYVMSAQGSGRRRVTVVSPESAPELAWLTGA